jgi:hypothetical protein
LTASTDPALPIRAGDGRFGAIATIQQHAKDALAACGRPETLTADGVFGSGTRGVLRELAACPAVSGAIAADADARQGAVTDRYWAVLVGGPPPTVDDRARTLMLTYEATDYTSMEWNFCQSAPRYNPAAGRARCFSNDPHSYLTWGPNGATAGGGREVQLILQAVDSHTPQLIDRSFGSEADAVRKMFHVVDRDAARTLETYLCGVWADAGRRQMWKSGFAAIGAAPEVRKAFDDFYRSLSLDGGKIGTFFKAYQANGLTPTEIDYGFFKDRAAQTSVSVEPVRSAIADALRASPDAPRWTIRRAIALNVRPGTQRDDRLGRDVAFYIDGSGGSLSAGEIADWRQRGPVRANDVGLSDQRNVPDFQPGPAIRTNVPDPQSLTPQERAACPQAVLDTRSP